MIRILIADDDPVALLWLELAVTRVPEAEVVAKASDGRQAFNLIKNLEPDVAILDIELPGLDGLNVVESLRSEGKVSEVVFVTAHQDYAVRAFGAHAVDYVLKPIELERFLNVMSLAVSRSHDRKSKLGRIRQIAGIKNRNQGAAKQPYVQEVRVREHAGLQSLAIEEIELITACGDCVQLHVGSRSYFYKDTIASLEFQLDPDMFLRVNRSAIIQLRSVCEIGRASGRKNFLRLRSGVFVPIGRNFVTAAFEALRVRR